MPIIIMLLIVLSFGISFECRAGEIKPYSCRNGLFPSEQSSLELVKVARTIKRLYFYRDDENCPGNEATCKSRNYVVAGDELIISKTVNGWACAWFHGKRHETVGWVRGDDLQFSGAETAVRPLADWAGAWSMHQDGSEIILTPKEDRLQVSGNAVWLGTVLDDGTRVAHTGELDGEMTPSGTKARLGSPEKEYECVADFTLLGRYLVVTDNTNCGGINVRFDGVYTRSR